MHSNSCIWVPPKEINDRLDGRYNAPYAVKARARLSEYGILNPINEVSHEVNCGPFGSTLMASEHDPRGEIILVQPTDIREPLFAQCPGWRISLKTLSDKGLDCYPKETLLFARVGYTHTGVLPERVNRATISSSMIAVTIDQHHADPYFLHAFFQSVIGQQILSSIQKVTAQPTISTEELAGLLVPGPLFEIQRAIGNKIRKAERLRELAEEVWNKASGRLAVEIGMDLQEDRFKDFDLTDLMTKDYKCLSTSPATFYTHLDEILGAQYYHPRRINARNIALLNGNAEPLSQLSTRIRRISQHANFVGLDRIDSLTGVIVPNDQSEQLMSGISFQKNDILFSRLRPYLNKVAIWRGKEAVGSTELVVYRAKPDCNPYYIFFVLKSALGMYQVVDVTSGSTHPRVDEDVIDSILVPRLECKQEQEIGNLVEKAYDYWQESNDLIPQAKQDIEGVIEGTLDQDALLDEGTQIETWLRKHPSPNTGETHHA